MHALSEKSGCTAAATYDCERVNSAGFVLNRLGGSTPKRRTSSPTDTRLSVGGIAIDHGNSEQDPTDRNPLFHLGATLP